jgi:hypothetical protein
MSSHQLTNRPLLFLALFCLLPIACNLGSSQGEEETTESPEIFEETDTVEPIQIEIIEEEIATITLMAPEEVPTDIILPEVSQVELIHPGDLVYLGSFRLPETGDDYGWGYSGYAMTFYPDGDPDGSDDGHPGSLFILGHDQRQFISEINIPAPVISEKKDVFELPTASTLQPFTDITWGMFGELEIPRAGLAYLQAQGSQTTGKLYFCWGQHFQFERDASHGWSDLNLSAPNPAGPWYLDDYTNYVTNDYLFEIPEDWAAIYTPGLRLVTGRFRDGNWGGLGPTLFAIGPWNEGNPPPPNATLQQVIPLLLYGEPIPGNPEIGVSDERRMVDYSEPDEWSGGAWLTDGEKSAVILVGTKAVGDSWYGFSNGVVYPISGDPDETYPEVPDWPHDDRGWWSQNISAQMIFFDASELAKVATGALETWDPQPYATLTLDEYLYDPGFDYVRYKRYLLGAIAFNRENGFLYIIERLADEDDRSLIHVFRITV